MEKLKLGETICKHGNNPMTCKECTEEEKIILQIREAAGSAYKECWNIIIEKMKESGIAEDDHRSRWLFAQRVANAIWMGANPQVSVVLSKFAEEKIEV